MLPDTPRIKIPFGFSDALVLEETRDYFLVASSKRFDSAKAFIPKFLNPKLAYFVGALRDGTISDSGSKYEVSFAQKDESWLNFLNGLTVELFKPINKPKIVRHKNCSPRLFLSSKAIFMFLNEVFEVPIGNKNSWNTPKLILNAPFEIQKYYVSGFFDADGVIRNDGRIGFCQANKRALAEIKTIIEGRGIKCCGLTYQPRNGVCYFNISKQDNEKFLQEIYSFNEAKRKNLPY
ncbi:hypothetical protein HY992_03920 [Candidatus Micrarchaeota archaeon]|nr:hypothetical protein [Candidatus Micrarchaeota archaeon]